MKIEAKLIIDCDFPEDYTCFLTLDGSEVRELIRAFKYIKYKGCDNTFFNDYQPDDDVFNHMLEVLDRVEDIK